MIKRTILAEIDTYKLQFKDCNEGFFIHWPSRYDLYGWLINMKSGGELAPHMHETGWVSGAVYINVPEKKQVNSGNFAVCIDGFVPKNSSRKNQHKVIDVQTGNMVLFPASLMHYTIPFISDEERIVLAFDIVPKN